MILTSTTEAASAFTEQRTLFIVRNRYVKKDGGYVWDRWKATPSDAGTMFASRLKMLQTRVLN